MKSGLTPVSSSRKNSQIFAVRSFCLAAIRAASQPFPLSEYHASFPLSNKTRYIFFTAEIRLFTVFLFFGGSVVLGCVDGIRPGSFGL